MLPIRPVRRHFANAIPLLAVEEACRVSLNDLKIEIELNKARKSTSKLCKCLLKDCSTHVWMCCKMNSIHIHFYINENKSQTQTTAMFIIGLSTLSWESTVNIIANCAPLTAPDLLATFVCNNCYIATWPKQLKHSVQIHVSANNCGSTSLKRRRNSLNLHFSHQRWYLYPLDDRLSPQLPPRKRWLNDTDEQCMYKQLYLHTYIFIHMYEWLCVLTTAATTTIQTLYVNRLFFRFSLFICNL